MTTIGTEPRVRLSPTDIRPKGARSALSIRPAAPSPADRQQARHRNSAAHSTTRADRTASELLYGRARGLDKTLKLWPGLRHELVNGPSRDDVIAFMLAWLDPRAGG